LIIEESDTTITVPKKMYYFMPGNVRMSCRMSGNPLLVWFEFAGPLCESIGPILSHPSDHITTGYYHYDQLKTVLQMAYVLQYHPQKFNFAIQSLLWRFISETACPMPYKQRGFSPEVVRVFNYIKTTPLNQKISVEDLARVSSLPMETFRKKFQTETGVPPLQYLLHYKIAKAKEMIGNQNMTIKQIAFEMGFTDPYYFSRLFKKFEHVSPQAFRKKIYHEDMFD